jgi:quinol monooxygenase YgiN
MKTQATFMPDCRAIAILKAKAGQEQALLDFTLSSVTEIRAVDGLRRLEVSLSPQEPEQLILYYWWESAAHSQRYVAGALYARLAPRLQALVAGHLLLVGDLVSADPRFP